MINYKSPSCVSLGTNASFGKHDVQAEREDRENVGLGPHYLRNVNHFQNRKKKEGTQTRMYYKF